jgi:uncharacterized membrane protein YraQ (UPF0718 family)
MQKLAEAIKATEEVFEVAEDVEAALSIFEEVAPFLAIAGFVLSFVKLFMPSETEMIMKALEMIMQQIANL